MKIERKENAKMEIDDLRCLRGKKSDCKVKLSERTKKVRHKIICLFTIRWIL